MPDVLLFGATGYTGRLTARALARRGASFAVAGRNKTKVEAIAREVGAADARIADAGDLDALRRAVADCRVLLTCVGPFVRYGNGAVRAALAEGVHYIDSTGEGAFIRSLLEQDGAARERGIAMAPAMGFDEVPADVGLRIAVDGLDRADATATYAVPTTPSIGTLRSALGIMLGEGCCLVDGRPQPFHAADESRVAPMPPPLGPKPAISAPLSIGDIASLHDDLRSFKPFVTSGGAQRAALRWARRPAGLFVGSAPGRRILEAVFRRLPEGPDEQGRRKRWTVLIEVSAAGRRRNVSLQGSDVYGLTAELLSAAAIEMAGDGYDRAGVLSPVQAFGLDFLRELLHSSGVEIQVFEPG
jgi:short subunit dehydrogenase-like uncharacterized protein